LKYNLDEWDKDIIKCLSKDGRVSFTEIASTLNVTEKTIRLRYKNLVDNGIISVVGVVNPVSIGIKAGAILQLKVIPQGMDQAIEALKSIREIRFITMTSGPYPLLAQIAVPGHDDITELILKINKLPFITEINTIIQHEVYKSSYDYF
jgi:Lrp/AsnC family transcriptional regulator, regulator for asnA, asnC and gidA